MARQLEDEYSLHSLLLEPSIESSATFSVVEASIKCIETKDDGKVPIFLIFGPKIKFLRWVRVFCFFVIYCMYTAYTSNARIILESITKEILTNGSIVGLSNPHLTYLLPTLLVGLPLLLSVFFGLISDYKHYQRTYMLSYSLISSLSSGFILMLCSFLIPLEGRYSEIREILIALIFLSITFHILGLSFFLSH